MIAIKQAGLTVVLLVFGGLSWAQESMPYDVAPDEPKGVVAGTFHAPTRLLAADGGIDAGEPDPRPSTQVH